MRTKLKRQSTCQIHFSQRKREVVYNQTKVLKEEDEKCIGHVQCNIFSEMLLLLRQSPWNHVFVSFLVFINWTSWPVCAHMYALHCCHMTGKHALGKTVILKVHIIFYGQKHTISHSGGHWRSGPEPFESRHPFSHFPYLHLEVFGKRKIHYSDVKMCEDRTTHYMKYEIWV